MTSARLLLPPEASSVPLARRFVTAHLVNWELGQLAWAATLVASELTTNAVVHVRSRLVLDIALHPTCVRITVSDTCADGPTRHFYSPTAGTGRGLVVIEALADSWGVDRGSRGKSVWVTLNLAESRTLPA